MDFLIDNAGTIIVSLVLIIAVIFAVRKIIKDKKNGVSSCGGSCSSCPKSAGCNQDKKNDR